MKISILRLHNSHLAPFCDWENVTANFIRRHAVNFIERKSLFHELFFHRRQTTMNILYHILLQCRSAETKFVNLFMLSALLGSAWLVYHFGRLAMLEISILIP